MSIDRRYYEYVSCEYLRVNEQGLIEWVVLYKREYLS